MSSATSTADNSSASTVPTSAPDGGTRQPVLALMRYILGHPLRPTAKLVGLAIATHLGPVGSGWCSVDQLRREVGSDERPACNSTISRALRELCQGTPTVSACLEQRRRGPGRAAGYRVRPQVLAWWAQRAQRKTERQAQRAKAKRAPTIGITAEPLPAGLQQFLAAYPPHRRHKSRPADLQLVWRERGAPDGAELEALMRDLERWKASHRWRGHGGRWVPNPGRFLRHPRYRDAPPASAVRSQLPGPRTGFRDRPPTLAPAPTPSEAGQEKVRALVGDLCAHLGANVPQAKVRL